MSKKIAPRGRKVRVVATLGPASSTPEMIETLMRAGADVFRINMSHGAHADKQPLVQAIRGLEAATGRPSTILFDLQGPKLRVGKFAGGRTTLSPGQLFVFDRDEAPGDNTRVRLPHPEIFQALQVGARLLLDDGKLVLRTLAVSPDRIEARVEVGGPLSDSKGLNVPDVVVPMAALTEKDRRDLSFALDEGADWIALSFVQRPEDVAEARRLIGGRAALLAKIEKPAALDRLDEIMELVDAVMVARGDLGVELPPEQVPLAQKRIVETARRMGRPVVVATQMLESMIQAPTPTRAEVSDVATAIYDGADAVMLSAESAAGSWPAEAVEMMDRIARAVEADPGYKARIHFTETLPDPTTADALSQAAREIADTVSAKAIVCFTVSGLSARRMARDRPSVPVMLLTPKLATARRAGVMWGTHAVETDDVTNVEQMVQKAATMVLREGLAGAGDRIVIVAGVPFGTPGSTNMLQVQRLTGREAD